MPSLSATSDTCDRDVPNTTTNTVRFRLPEKHDEVPCAQDGQQDAANATTQPTNFEAAVSPQVAAMPWSTLPAFSADTFALSASDCALDDRHVENDDDDELLAAAHTDAV